jgi:glycosyltransferase involved in cell wall biosynthesis
MSKFQFHTDAFESKSVPSIVSAKARRVHNARLGKPRIVMVGMHLNRTRGGITTLTESILRSPLNKKYEITFIASQAEDFGIIRKLLLAVIAAVRFAASWVWKRPDIAYVHVGSNASLYRESGFILLARVLRRPVIAHFHAGDVGSYLPRQPQIGRTFIQWALGCSQKIIAVSRESAGYLKKMLPSTAIAVLPNVIDLTWLPEPIIRSDRMAGERRVKLLFVGSVGKLKGEKDLISALGLLQKRGIDLGISFVGYGAESLADLCKQAGISEMIEHLGPVPMSERAAFYREADIFVLPTYAEAMPLSVIEAMAAGLPVICTPVGGVPEIINDGKEGVLFPCGDVTKLAENIAFLVEDEDTRVRMGDLARKRATEMMDFEKYIDDLDRVIESVRGGKA